MMKNTRLSTLLLISLWVLPLFEATASDIQWNGFGSVYGGKSITTDIYPSYLTDTRVQAASLTHFGLNAGAKMSDNLQVSAQILANGSWIQGAGTEPNWPMLVNWFFLSYNVTPEIEIKAGRQLYPAWLASEFYYVGFLQPYRSIPLNVRNLIFFAAFDGLSSTLSFPVSNFFRTQLTFFGGQAAKNTSSATTQWEFDASNLLGSTLTFSGEGFKARLMISRWTISGHGAQLANTTVTPLLVGRSDTTNLSFGAMVDQSNFVLWGEFGKLIANNGTDGFFRLLYGGYLLAGYRIGDFLPRYTYTFADWSQSGIPGKAKAKTHTIGLNYKISSQMVAKGDFDVFLNPDGTPPNGTVAVTGAPARASAVTLGVDFIF